MLLFRSDIDGAKTLFANFIILGLIPPKPEAFVEFNPFTLKDFKSAKIEIHNIY